MSAAILPVHPGLFGSGRLPSLARPDQGLSALEAAVLLLSGATAAALSATLDFHLRIPGHAIIRSVFPMALGLALVPRRFAGVGMGIGAFLTSYLLKAAGSGIGPGALTSLYLTGPCLDLALLKSGGAWRLVPRFVLAGLGANVIALVIRFVTRGFEWDHERPMAEWFRQAAFSYPLCGLIAGLISVVVWFQLREQQKSEPLESAL